MKQDPSRNEPGLPYKKLAGRCCRDAMCVVKNDKFIKNYHLQYPKRVLYETIMIIILKVAIIMLDSI